MEIKSLYMLYLVIEAINKSTVDRETKERAIDKLISELAWDSAACRNV